MFNGFRVAVTKIDKGVQEGYFFLFKDQRDQQVGILLKLINSNKMYKEIFMNLLGNPFSTVCVAVFNEREN